MNAEMLNKLVVQNQFNLLEKIWHSLHSWQALQPEIRSIDANIALLRYFDDIRTFNLTQSKTGYRTSVCLQMS